VIACSGKVYTTSSRRAPSAKNADVAIMRVRGSSIPLPHKAFAPEMKKYPKWPRSCGARREQNQGAWVLRADKSTRTWSTARSRLRRQPGSASPAVATSTCTRKPQKNLASNRRSASSRARADQVTGQHLLRIPENENTKHAIVEVQKVSPVVESVARSHLDAMEEADRRRSANSTRS